MEDSSHVPIWLEERKPELEYLIEKNLYESETSLLRRFQCHSDMHERSSGN